MTKLTEIAREFRGIYRNCKKISDMNNEVLKLDTMYKLTKRQHEKVASLLVYLDEYATIIDGNIYYSFPIFYSIVYGRNISASTRKTAVSLAKQVEAVENGFCKITDVLTRYNNAIYADSSVIWRMIFDAYHNGKITTGYHSTLCEALTLIDEKLEEVEKAATEVATVEEATVEEAQENDTVTVSEVIEAGHGFTIHSSKTGQTLFTLEATEDLESTDTEVATTSTVNDIAYTQTLNKLDEKCNALRDTRRHISDKKGDWAHKRAEREIVKISRDIVQTVGTVDRFNVLEVNDYVVLHSRLWLIIENLMFMYDYLKKYYKQTNKAVFDNLNFSIGYSYEMFEVIEEVVENMYHYQC